MVPLWLTVLGEAVAIVLIVVGLVGTLIPVLPGTVIIFAGSLLLGWVTGFHPIDARTLIALGLVAALSQLLGQLAGWFGGKVIGSSWWGVAGAIIGSILAIVVPVPFGIFGFVVYPFLGAFAFELIGGKTLRRSLRSGLGSALGVLGGVVMQVVFGLLMVVILLRAWF